MVERKAVFSPSLVSRKALNLADTSAFSCCDSLSLRRMTCMGVQIVPIKQIREYFLRN